MAPAGEDEINADDDVVCEPIIHPRVLEQGGGREGTDSPPCTSSGSPLFKTGNVSALFFPVAPPPMSENLRTPL